jgi:hypothetical protein
LTKKYPKKLRGGIQLSMRHKYRGTGKGKSNRDGNEI